MNVLCEKCLGETEYYNFRYGCVTETKEHTGSIFLFFECKKCQHITQESILSREKTKKEQDEWEKR